MSTSEERLLLQKELTEIREMLQDNQDPQMSDSRPVDVVYIARCPEHGLHGERTECFECGGPVEQVAMVPLGEHEPLEVTDEMVDRAKEAFRTAPAVKHLAYHTAFRAAIEAALIPPPKPEPSALTPALTRPGPSQPSPHAPDPSTSSPPSPSKESS